jgi:parallel beta-helix repeat protein
MQIALLVALLWLVLTAVPATATTYYASAGGHGDTPSDSNPCAAGPNSAQNLATPKATINAGIVCLSAGDTLYIRGGTYAETLNSFDGTMFPSGTSWSNPVTIAGYPGETVIVKPNAPTAGVSLVAIYDGGSYTDSSYRQYIIFDSLVFDSSNLNGSVIKLDLGSRHIRVQNSKVIGNNGGNGIEWGSSDSAPDTTAAREHEIINVEIYGNAGYGLYVEGTNNIIDGNSIHDNNGYGVHVYRQGSTAVNNNTIRNNIIRHNGYAYNLATCALLLSSGDNNVAYNNLISDHNGCGIQIYGNQTNGQAYNNTIVGNAAECILNQAGSSGAIIRNNICWNNAGDISDLGTATIKDHNWPNATDPHFVNAGAGNYQLSTTAPVSGAIDAGCNYAGGTFCDATQPPITTVIGTTDQAGNARIINGTIDMGALEAGTASPSTCGGVCTIYLSAGGHSDTPNDSNPCTGTGSAQNLTTPKATLASALACLDTAGSTVSIRGGTYHEALDTQTTPLVASSSWAAPTTLQAYAAEVPVFQLPVGSGASVVFFLRNATTDHFILLQGLTLDAAATAGSNALAIYSGVGDIRFRQGELKNSYYEAAYIAGATNVEVSRTRMHDSQTIAGVTLDGGSGDLLANNVIYNNGVGINLATVSGALSGTLLYNNTVVSNRDTGILVTPSVTSTTVTNNLVVANPNAQITNQAGGQTTLTTNLTTGVLSLLCVSPATNDFHLLAGATAAIDHGTTLGGFTTDFDGTTRGNGGNTGPAWDIGAYEFVQAPPARTTLRLRPLR